MHIKFQITIKFSTIYLYKVYFNIFGIVQQVNLAIHQH